MAIKINFIFTSNHTNINGGKNMKSLFKTNKKFKEEINMKENKKRNQGTLTVETWHGGRQGDLDGGTWHGGRQGDLNGGTWHGGRQGDLDGGTWHSDKEFNSE